MNLFTQLLLSQKISVVLNKKNSTGNSAETSRIITVPTETSMDAEKESLSL